LRPVADLDALAVLALDEVAAVGVPRAERAVGHAVRERTHLLAHLATRVQLDPAGARAVRAAAPDLGAGFAALARVAGRTEPWAAASGEAEHHEHGASQGWHAPRFYAGIGQLTRLEKARR